MPGHSAAILAATLAELTGDDRKREGADGAEQLFERVVVAQRVAPATGKFVNVMAGGPDAQSGRRAEHNGAHALGSQALEPGDDTVGRLGAEGIARALVVKGDDANLPAFIGPDGAAREASSRVGDENRGVMDNVMPGVFA